MKVLLVYAMSLFLLPALKAQVKITSIKDRQSESSWLSFSFPLVHSANKTIEKKINSFLQKEILDNPVIITDPTKIFSRSAYTRNDSFTQSGYSMLDYSIEVNGPRILSIDFDIEATGAYSSNYKQYYNFDLQNGSLIQAKKLFTPAGIQKIRTWLIAERKKRISKALAENPDESDSSVHEDSVFISEAFETCNMNADEENIFIRKQSIIFYKEFCFPHALRPYDIDLDVEIPIKELQSYFTEYGKKNLPAKTK